MEGILWQMSSESDADQPGRELNSLYYTPRKSLKGTRLRRVLKARGRQGSHRGTRLQASRRNLPAPDYKYTSEVPTKSKMSDCLLGLRNRSYAGGRGYRVKSAPITKL
jgi:hypothetical protein